MILLLLFSISSTIRASDAQKPKLNFFTLERSQQGMPLKIIKKFSGFSEILSHNISCEFTSFFIFCSNQKSANFFLYNFQRHFMRPTVFAHAHNAIIVIWVLSNARSNSGRNKK